VAFFPEADVLNEIIVSTQPTTEVINWLQAYIRGSIKMQMSIQNGIDNWKCFKSLFRKA
jgi:hypothetical protein